MSAPADAHGALLEVSALHTGYGASPVLHGVELHIAAGEALGLLGRNGMGKTTLVRAVMGLIPSRSGCIAFRGESIFGQAAQRIARRGIGLVPEGRQIFPNLTVEEHLVAFERPRAAPIASEYDNDRDAGPGGGKRRASTAAERIERLEPDRIARMGLAVVPEGRQIFPNLSVRENLVAASANRTGRANPWTLARVFEFFPRLGERQANRGNQLSGGEQQMLAIGRALMTNPRLLILDEATEGLAPLIRDEIWRCLSMLKARGQSVLVIDKNIENLTAIADRHYIIERGRAVWSGTSEQLIAQPDLQHRYLGV